jgi:hypothetical protein
MKNAIAIIISIFIAFYFWAGFSFISKSAATYDETIHLSSGYSYIETGKYYINIMDHPPLSEMIAAIPLRFMRLNSFVSHKFFVNFMPYSYADLFIYKNNEDAEKILNSARVFVFILWSSAFIIAFYIIGRLLFKEYYFIPIILFLVNPLFISNLSLITTDAAPSFFYFISFIIVYLIVFKEEYKLKILNNPYSLSILAGIINGLAITSKYSMFITPPLWCFSLIFLNIFCGNLKFSKVMKIILLNLILTILTILAVFKGDFNLFCKALYETFMRLDNGRSFFINGVYGTQGVWWYFPMAFFYKNSILLVLSFLLGIYFVLKDWRKYFWLIAPLFSYLGLSFMAKVNIGIRHLLPAIPFIIIVSSTAIVYALKKFKLKAFIIISSFFIFSFYHLLKAHPFYLGYFNEFIGHENGYKYLVDSNLDWGQDIKTLAEYLKKNGNPPVILSYFGSANPNYYQIKFIPLLSIASYNIEPNEKLEMKNFKRILLAVSATNLQGVYYPDKNIFAFLKNIKPIYVAGNSIFLYDITDNKDALNRVHWESLFEQKTKDF